MCRTLNNKINKLHERALLVIYKNDLSLQQLLEKDNSITIHDSNCMIHNKIGAGFLLLVAPNEV